MQKDEYPIRPILEHFGFDLKDHPSKVKCVFHDDTHASAIWNDYHFNCLACGVKGDAVGLLHRQGGLSYAEAYKRVTELCGAPPPKSRRAATGRPGSATMGKGRGRSRRVSRMDRD